MLVATTDRLSITLMRDPLDGVDSGMGLLSIVYSIPFYGAGVPIMIGSAQPRYVSPQVPFVIALACTIAT